LTGISVNFRTSFPKKALLPKQQQQYKHATTTAAVAANKNNIFTTKIKFVKCQI